MHPPSVLKSLPLGHLWPTLDPFLFCAHHHDSYPQGAENYGPVGSLVGRELGADFSGQDGWSMYHGQSVAGFPAHPHRGFETVTIVRSGWIDHADSLGAAARYGAGDVQWLTAGSGMMHSEMFPLLNTHSRNPLELFQVWLNLPAQNKMVPPHFTMFWNEAVPHHTFMDENRLSTSVRLIAGKLPIRPDIKTQHDSNSLVAALEPPPHSWAAQIEADIAILCISMAPGARWVLPGALGEGTRRMLYYFDGMSVEIDGHTFDQRVALELQANTATDLVNTGGTSAELLLLQGRPLNEPVAQHGPFVMNTNAEVAQAVADFRRTQFGGWPWPDSAPVHGPEQRRFVRHPGRGTEETPTVVTP